MDANVLIRKKLFLLDLDGTVYLGDKIFDGVLNFLSFVDSIGGKFVFLSNNSSKSVTDYIEKLQNFGINVEASNFMTASTATSLHIRRHYINKIAYVLGTESFKTELRRDGIIVKDQFSEEIDLLLVGFDTELSYSKLEDACRILSKDVTYLATNPDLVCPTQYGFVPDCGSICKMLETATGKVPTFIGKPSPTMINLSIENNSFLKEETIIIGDRLYTDILCGINAGITTALVLTGETKISDLYETKYTPDFVFENICELFRMIQLIINKK